MIKRTLLAIIVIFISLAGPVFAKKKLPVYIDYGDIGNNYMKIQQYDRAKEAYIKEINQNPCRFSSYSKIGLIYMLEKNDQLSEISTQFATQIVDVNRNPAACQALATQYLMIINQPEANFSEEKEFTTPSKEELDRYYY